MDRHLQLAMRRPNSIAHLVKGRILLKPGQNRYEDALKEMERAIVLDPNEFNAHVNMALVLIFMGRPEEGIPHIEKALSVDPLNPARPLWMFGFAYFGMDRYDEAVSYMERAIKPRPHSSHWALIAAYAQAGRTEEAADTLKRYSQLRKYKEPPTVSTLLTYHPYKNENDRERLAQGLLAAGLSGHYDLSDDNRLTGDEIRSGILGRTVTGIFRKTGRQYWITFDADGTTSFRGGERDPDMGRAWIEGDQLCTQWHDIRKGDAGCVFVYRNPERSADRPGEYAWEATHDVRWWSLVD